MLLALLLACHSAAASKASDETIRVVGDRGLRRQGLSGSTARNAAAEMIKSKLATQTARRRLECVNDDSTTDRDGDSCSKRDGMTIAPEDCGFWDDEDFTASEQCCACGGGEGTFAPTAASERCVNDDSTTDRDGDTCSSVYDSYPGDCGKYDDEDFTASEQCCACGGGLYGGTFAPTATFAPTVSPLIADDDSIRTAVALWVSDRAAAEAKYGHISTWETGGVTGMSYLFHLKSSFNDDIGAWDTSGVTNMIAMFSEATSFDQDIGAWDTSGVTWTNRMFEGASAFNQDIGGWAVHNVRSMHRMFASGSFNQSLSAWRVDNVKDMSEMFNLAESFNQPLNNWNVSSDVDISYMFYYASAFDQDLGWCVTDPYSDYDDDDDDDPWNDDGGGRRLSCFFCGPFDLDWAFYGTKCESTSCGVSICNTDAAPARRISVAAAVAALVSVLIA